MTATNAPDQKGYYAFHNSLEEVVEERARAIVSKMDNMCHCEKCFFDICAMVLNQLTPKYVTTPKGTLMAKLPSLSSKKELELTILITKTAKMVQEKPMH